MKTLATTVILGLSMMLSGCGTYYDAGDPYTRGLRWYDRGRIDLAEQHWRPLVANADPDAEFRYGWMLWNNQLGKNRELEAIELFRKASDQGQPKALLILADLYYQSPNNPTWEVTNAPFPKDLEMALMLYLKAEKMAYYAPDKAKLASVLPKIKAEMASDKIRTIELAILAWKPVIVGREPRKLF